MGLLGEIKAYLAERLDVHLTSNNRSRKSLIKNSVVARGGSRVNQTINNYTVNLSLLQPEDRRDLISSLKEEFEKGEVIFLDDQSRQLANTVQAAEAKKDIGDQVDYFRNKLTVTDWQVFRTGLYINHLLEQGMPTAEVRKSVIQTYGSRGRNILNLACAGHFSSHIKPLYDELSKSPEFSGDMFYEEFERILKEMPFAIFVNAQVTSTKLREMIDERIQQAKDYAVNERKVYVHGWGQNVRTIEVCIDSLNPEYKIQISKRREIVSIIDATIEF